MTTAVATTLPNALEGAGLVEHKLHRAWRKEQLFHHTRGGCFFLLWALALVLVDLAVDFFFLIPGYGRVALLAINVGAIGWVLYHHWLRYLRRYDPVRTALQVERRHPELQSLLVSFVQLRGGAPEGTFASPSLIRAMQRQTIETTRPLDFREIVSYKELKRIFVLAGCVMVFFAAISINWSEHLRRLVLRMLNPSAHIGYPTATHILGIECPESVQQGKKVLLEARAGGHIPDDGILYVKFEGGGDSWDRVPLLRSAPHLLNVEDVPNLPGLAAKVKQEADAGKPSVGKRIWELLPQDLRTAFQQAATAKELDKADAFTIVKTLNDILKMPDLYRQEDFRGVTLPAEAAQLVPLVAKGAPPDEVHRLNRLLLQAAFPEAINAEGEAEKVGRFPYLFPDVYQSFRCHVRLGDAYSEEFSVAVIPPPRIVETYVRYRYPSYTGMDERIVDMLNLEAPAGTRIQWRLRCDEPLASATLVKLLDEKRTEPFPMSLDPSGQVASLEMEAVTSFDYQFKWVEREHGYAYDEETQYTVQVIADTSPQVEVLKPLEDEKATVQKTVSIAFQARDDYGLTVAWIVYSLEEGAEPQRRPLGKLSGRLVEKEVPWTVREAIPGLKPGDVVTYFIEVADNHSGPNGAFRGTSQTRRLYIVKVDEYLTYIAERRKKLVAELKALHEQETQAADKVGDILKDALK